MNKGQGAMNEKAARIREQIQVLREKVNKWKPKNSKLEESLEWIKIQVDLLLTWIGAVENGYEDSVKKDFLSDELQKIEGYMIETNKNLMEFEHLLRRTNQGVVN